MDLLGLLQQALPRGNKYVLAVSGGSDSMALLHAAARCLPVGQLVVAHFNHRTRGKASEGDEAFVCQTAQGLQIPSYVGHRKGDRTDENALRLERRRFLQEIRQKTASDFIVTAHHQGDQLETFLMRLLRGSGLRGLGAMRPRQGMWLKPWLSVPKDELKAFLQGQGLAYREDDTNHSPRYFRNRVRAELVPTLLSTKPHANQFLSRLQGTLSELQWAEKVLEKRTRTLYRKLCVVTPLWIRIPLASFLALDPQYQYRLLRHIAKALKAPTPSRTATLRMVSLLGKKNRAAQTEGFYAQLSCGHVFFHRPGLQKVQWEKKRGSTFETSLGIELEQVSEDTALEWRTARAGDRFQGKKLKHLFLKHRVPRPERSLTPVLAHKGTSEIVWWLAQGTNERVRILKLAFPFSYLA